MNGYELLQAYKDDCEELRGNVEGLMNDLIDKNEQILKSIHPTLIDDYKTLKKQIKDQKDENE